MLRVCEEEEGLISGVFPNLDAFCDESKETETRPRAGVGGVLALGARVALLLLSAGPGRGRYY